MALATWYAAIPQAQGAERDPILPQVSRPLQEWARNASSLPQVVVIEAQGSALALQRAMAQSGLEPEVVGGSWVQLTVSGEDLVVLAGFPEVRHIRHPHWATPKGQDTTTEGLADVFAVEDWHKAGLTGEGSLIAVVDVGFSGADQLPETDRPTTLTWNTNEGLGSSPHGTAVLEILHDMAPGAELRLLLARTDVEFLSAIESLLQDPPDVINASLGFDNVWHTDGTGPLSQAVDELVAATGATWVAAAGNENNKYRIGVLEDADEDGLLEINGEEGTWIPLDGDGLQASFRWSEDMEAAEIDLDLHAYLPDGTLCAAATEPQDGPGSSPYETISSGCSGSDAWVVPVLADPNTALPELTGYLYARDGLYDGDWTGSENLTLPADAASALAVGACDRTMGVATDSSSRGPTTDGRIKPDICGPTGVSTVTYGTSAFIGTSASAPHAAGLAALVPRRLDLVGSEAMAEWLGERAEDLGDPGLDNVFGRGALQAGEAPSGCGCQSVPDPGFWLSTCVLAGLAGLRRRKENLRR